MLAASPGGSNVPPDDLQTTPVAAFSTRPAQWLGKNAAGPGPQPDPTPATQQDATVQNACRAPAAVVTKYRGAPVGGQSQTQAVTPGTTQSREFPARQADPGGANRDQQCW